MHTIEMDFQVWYHGKADTLPRTSSWNELIMSVNSLSNGKFSLQVLPPIFYEDDEGEMIAVSCYQDLKEAFNWAQSANKALKLVIIDDENDSDWENVSTTSSPAKVSEPIDETAEVVFSDEEVPDKLEDHLVKEESEDETVVVVEFRN